MSSTSAAWNDVNDAVLEAFRDRPLTIRDVHENLPGVPDSYIRAALAQNVERGYLTSRCGAVRTTYTLTAAGRRHLIDTVKVG